MESSTHISIILDAIKRHGPDSDLEHTVALAHAWKLELDKIMELVLQYGDQAEGFTVHVNFREEVIFEFFRLSEWLAAKIVAVKTATTPLGEINPEEEIAAATSSTGVERIKNTARNVADCVWIKLLRRWNQESRKLLELDGSLPIDRRSNIEIPGRSRGTPTEKNHFISELCTKYWADVNGAVKLYSRQLNGSVRARLVGHGTWAYEFNLYSQRLEDYFSVLESDAKAPYEKLLKGLPLNGLEVRSWITFLIIQYLRNPAFIRPHVAGVMEQIQGQVSEFWTRPESMKRAYETLFNNSELYTYFYREIERRPWTVLAVPDDEFFIMSDAPLVLNAGLNDPKASIFYPLSPERCFVAEPLTEERSWPLKMRPYRLQKGEAEKLNILLALNAYQCVISRVQDDSPNLRDMLARHLGASKQPEDLLATIEIWWKRIRER